MSIIDHKTITNGVSITAAGSYTSPLTITSTGVLSIGNHGNDVYSLISNPTLVNQGLITATGNYVYGVLFTAGGYVNNTGNILCNYPDDKGIVISRNAGTVANSGTISGFKDGVYLYLNGSIGNSGLIAGGNGIVIGASNGIGVASTAITNSGTIAATAGDGRGIELLTVGTVINSGTISGGASGGYAVEFLGASSSSRLIVDPGAVFVGKASFAGEQPGRGATLEMAVGGQTGTISGLDSEFTGFTQVIVDAGANWLLAGSSLGEPGGFALPTETLTVAGNLTVAGSFTDAGPVVIAAGGTAAFQGAVSNPVLLGSVGFAAASGSLELDDLASAPGGTQQQDFNVPIAGFVSGDQIRIATSGLGNFTGLDAATAGSFNDTTTPLALTSGGATVGTLTLKGNYASDLFSVSAPAAGLVTISVTIPPPPPTFAAPQFVLADFGASPSAGGWGNQATYPVAVGDVTGDGMADIVGFGAAGVYVSLATGGGNFAQPILGINAFGANAGWGNQGANPLELGDVTGNHRADIVGFGSAGVYVSLSNGDGTVAQPILGINAFGAAGGWGNQDAYPLELGDVTGNGRDDIVGLGSAGVYVSLANGAGTFAQPIFALNAFGAAGGWGNQSAYPVEMGDVTGNGRDDIVGFGSAGVYVSLANGDGTFAQPILALNAFGAAAGWGNQQLYPIELADVLGNGRDDIVAFGAAGVYVALANGDGTFAQPTLATSAFGAAGGWSSQNQFPRLLGDVNGDKRGDIVGFGSAGVYVALSQPQAGASFALN